MIDVKKWMAKVTARAENQIYAKQVGINFTARTIPAHGSLEVFNGLDVTQYIGAGNTLIGVVFNWTSGSYCFGGNVQVLGNNTIYLRITNATATAQSVSSVVLTFIYKLGGGST